MELFDFNSNAIIGSDIHTTLNGSLLILKEVYYYDGPITMQYLPYGGIQAVINNQLIINCKDGFITCKYVIYNNKVLSLTEFISQNKNLVNMVLPN